MTMTSDIGFSWLNFETAVSKEWEVQLTLNERDVSWSIIHDHYGCDLWVTMVVWVDVLDSDQGDFRHQRAVNTSSYFTDRPVLLTNTMNILQSDSFLIKPSLIIYIDFDE